MAASTLLDLQRKAFGPLFEQITGQTIGNSIVETALFAAGVGSLTIPANFMRAGHHYRLNLYGYCSNTGTPTITLRPKFAGTALNTTTFTTVSGLTNSYFDIQIDMSIRTIGAAGTLWLLGRMKYIPSAGAVVNHAITAGLVNTAVSVINTTVASAFNLTWQWGTANVSNTVTVAIANLELITMV